MAHGASHGARHGACRGASTQTSVPSADETADAHADAPSGGAPASSGGAPAPPPFLQQLLAVPPGTPLYEVLAVGSPADALPGAAEAGGLRKIGTLVSRSPFMRTRADDALVFWHQRREEDYQLRPEWRRSLRDFHANDCSAERFAAIARRSGIVPGVREDREAAP